MVGASFVTKITAKSRIAIIKQSTFVRNGFSWKLNIQYQFMNGGHGLHLNLVSVKICPLTLFCPDLLYVRMFGVYIVIQGGHRKSWFIYIKTGVHNFHFTFWIQYSEKVRCQLSFKNLWFMKSYFSSSAQFWPAAELIKLD